MPLNSQREKSSGRPDIQRSPDWNSVVAGVAANDEVAILKVYRFLSRSIRFYLYQQLGAQEVDDCLHNVLMIVVTAIQRGQLREACALPAFAKTVARRQVAATVNIRNRQAPIDDHYEPISSAGTFEDCYFRDVEHEVMGQVLKQLSARDRDILNRFYVLEQTKEQICMDLHLTETQFRLIKSRAKGKFVELGTRRMKQRKPGSVRIENSEKS